MIRSIAFEGAPRGRQSTPGVTVLIKLALLAMIAVLFAGCSKPKNDTDTEKPIVAEEFNRASKPSIPAIVINTAATTPSTTAATPAQWNYGEIYPMPLRQWLPPADTLENVRTLPGDLRIATSAPSLLPDSPLPTLNISAPSKLALPAPAPAQSPSPDPTLVTVFIATSPAPEMRGRQPIWDRPQLATDPTVEMSRTFPLDAPIGLRETTPPFVRVSIPTPAAETRIAGLNTPLPETTPPVAPFTRPLLAPFKVVEQK